MQAIDRIDPETDPQDSSVPLMTVRTVQAFCVADGLPSQPDLNEKLYLSDKGFSKILDIGQYHNLTCLWLNKNNIGKIENLECLGKLVCLYLNDNHIKKIEGLDTLLQLQILNLENNKIQLIENLSSLPSLRNLNLAQNLLTNSESIQELSQIPKLSSLDLSRNQLQNSKQVYDLIAQLKTLTCLHLKSTGFARGLMNYRKNMIAVLPKLKFLDDRPVLETQHTIFEAWLAGGIEEEKKERLRILNQETQRAKEIRRKQIQEMQDNAADQDQFYKKKEPSNTTQQKPIKISTSTSPEQNPQKPDNKKNIQAEPALEQNKQKESTSRWQTQYQPLLQCLLQKYEFDFPEVHPRLNMILTGIHKKINKKFHRFEMVELQQIWTTIELRKRGTSPIQPDISQLSAQQEQAIEEGAGQAALDVGGDVGND